MPVIKAFRGWRYNRQKVENIGAVLAPPYDVISKEEQRALYQRHACNVIRLILGREQSGDGARNNKYVRAGRLLRKWMASGVLAKEDAPAVYVYVQDYREGKKIHRRVGFMAAMKIDEKAVLRHENTLASPKRDRLALLKEVRANLSPIFGLIEDRAGGVDRILRQTLKLSPAVDVSTGGVRHRLFVEKRRECLSKLGRSVAKKPVYIADGHHRFEVACQFRRLMLSKKPKSAPSAEWNYVMTYFSDLTHNPFSIFPTHRLVRISGVLKDPFAVLAKRGALEKVGSLAAVLSRLRQVRTRTGHPDRYEFGLYTKKQGFYILTLDKAYSGQSPNPADRLDVAVLHQKLLEPCFHIQAIEKSQAIDFTRDPRHAVGEVRRGTFDMAFFVRPTSLQEMIEVSKQGLRMPQKSTYFYPKLLSGLVFHSFDPDPAR